MKFKIINNLNCIMFYIFLCWASAEGGFHSNYSYYILTFLSLILIFVFLFMEICDRICEAITENNGYNRRVDVELCKILHALSRIDEERDK